MPADLSGGMRQRVGLARALALDPQILFLDEPSAGLDPIAAKRFDDLILQLRDGFGVTVVMVSHELPSLFGICDDGVFLDAATHTAIAHGAPKTLRDSCDQPAVHAFMTRERPAATRRPREPAMTANKPLLVGAFVLGGLALGVLAILLFGGAHLFSRTAHRQCLQGSVAGLTVGSPVTFRGVNIGKVDACRCRSTRRTIPGVIPVYMVIEPGKVEWTNGVLSQRRAEHGGGDQRRTAGAAALGEPGDRSADGRPGFLSRYPDRWLT
jgi:hypothetical protein